MEIKEDCKSIYGDCYSFSVKAYLAKQFHCLRLGKGINNEEFSLSLCKSVVKREGIGKSSALFRQTHDNRFLLKGVEKKEVRMFLGMAPGYLEYMHGSLYQSKDSIINACVGVYKVHVKNLNTGKWRVQFLMVFDKIGYGLPAPHVVYDLKGTTNKRRRVKEGDKKSKMDLNFLEDFKSIPVSVSRAEMEFLSKGILNDTAFLCKCNVIDYSLLLVVCLSERKIAVGLIDYMQKYTFDKVIENKYKTVVSSQVPTIISPEMYKERFCDTVLKQYFIVIDE
jgi:1-phosphatidylinositol-3-phosphate 5-kinase